MRFFKWYAMLLIIVLAQTIAGCGGGGGESAPPSTKTVILKFTSQNEIPVQIGGFFLTVILPDVSVLPTEIKTDSEGAAVVVPLSNVVFLSGKFKDAPPLSANTFLYNSTLRELNIYYPTINGYALGEFLTVIMTVPSNFMLSKSDINITLFKAYAPLIGADMPSVTATATFN